MPSPRFRRFHGSYTSVLMFFAGFAGAVVLLFAGHTTYRNCVARTWPTADGLVISARTVQERVGKGGRTVPKAEVWFAYEVGGRWYESANVSYHRGIGGTRRTYDPGYAATYPVGTNVKVAYNPADPADAVVDVSRDPHRALVIGTLLVAAFVGYQFWLRGDDTAARSRGTAAAVRDGGDAG